MKKAKLNIMDVCLVLSAAYGISETAGELSEDPELIEEYLNDRLAVIEEGAVLDLCADLVRRLLPMAACAENRMEHRTVRAFECDGQTLVMMDEHGLQNRVLEV